jgi:hypothetical protein
MHWKDVRRKGDQVWKLQVPFLMFLLSNCQAASQETVHRNRTIHNRRGNSENRFFDLLSGTSFICIAVLTPASRQLGRKEADLIQFMGEAFEFGESFEKQMNGNDHLTTESLIRELLPPSFSTKSLIS